MTSNLFLYLLAAVLLIVLFAGIEIAFVSASKLNIELRRKQGIRSARILSRIMDRPNDFLGASRVLINVLLVLFGLLMTEVTHGYLRHLPQPLNTTWASLFIITAIATGILLIFAELLPKALFRRKAETILGIFAYPIAFVNGLFGPISRFFVSLSQLVLKYLFNVRINEKAAVFNRVDVEHFARHTLYSHETDADEVNERIFENALQLVHTRVRQCMVPRNEIVAVELHSPISEVAHRMLESHLSRIVVYEGTIDKIVGYIHHLALNNQPPTVAAALYPIMAVPEAMQSFDLLNTFTKERRSVAWVVDEFGGTAGIITIEDVLEEIFGNIYDEYDVEAFVEKQISDTEYIFSGRLELGYLRDKYGFEFGDSPAGTLSGYIIAACERIPRNRERIIVDKFEFEVLLVSGTRIDSVKMKVLK